MTCEPGASAGSRRLAVESYSAALTDCGSSALDVDRRRKQITTGLLKDESSVKHR